MALAVIKTTITTKVKNVIVFYLYITCFYTCFYNVITVCMGIFVLFACSTVHIFHVHCGLKNAPTLVDYHSSRCSQALDEVPHQALRTQPCTDLAHQTCSQCVGPSHCCGVQCLTRSWDPSNISETSCSYCTFEETISQSGRSQLVPANF